MHIHLSEQIQFCTARLEGTDGYMKNVGTGFLFSYKNKIYLVTNRHVVGKVGWKGTTKFLARKDDYSFSADFGKIIELEVNFELFHYHPNKEVDIAILDIHEFCFNNKPQPYIFFFDETVLPDIRKVLIMRPQEEVLFVGYPRGIWDDTNMLPITRRGIMATNFEYDYKGKPVFLIDGSVFEGSSGSPVFVFKTPPATGRDLHPISTEFLCFVGILSATQFESTATVTRQVGEGAVENIELKTYLNLGTVYKPSTIIETIDDYITSVAVIPSDVSRRD